MIKKLTACSLAAVLCGMGQEAFAHTTVKDKATEGTSAYNALQIGHGCTVETGKGEKKLPVIAQSVVFPSVNPIVKRADGTPTTLAAEGISQALNFKGQPAGMVVGTSDLVQDDNIFKKQDEKYDSLGNLIGWYGAKGKLQTNLRGLVPFRFTPPVFAANSCVKTLNVKIAIADICKLSFPPREGTANLWIPNATTTFADGEIDGSSATPLGGAPATLTINRKNALDASCGAGYDVTVWPSDEDVDANLPIKGWGK